MLDRREFGAFGGFCELTKNRCSKFQKTVLAKYVDSCRILIIRRG